MSKENIIVARRETDGTLVQVLPDGSTRSLKDKTDWKRLRAMAEDEVHAAALADPDAQPLTDADFARMTRVPRVKTLRRALRLTEEEFATRYHIPLGTLQDWEQGRCEPDQPARAYLLVIASDPEKVKRALEHPPIDDDIARYERENVNRIQKRVADISITTSVVWGIGFKGALAVSRKFVAELDLSELGQARDEHAFIAMLDKKTGELQLRLQEQRGRQASARSTDAKLWGSARKVLNVFLCEAYFNRVLEPFYGLRKLANWFEIPLDKQTVSAVRRKAEQFGLQGPPPFPGIKWLDRETSLKYQALAREIATEMLLPARIYFEVVTWAAANDGQALDA
jgi:putative transcriptional regulator